MKVTIDGLIVEGTESEVLRLIKMYQNGSKTSKVTEPVEHNGANHSEAPNKPTRKRATRRVGSREAEIIEVMRAVTEPDGSDGGIRTKDLAPLINWGDEVKNDAAAAVSRTSATLCALQKKRLVIRPQGNSHWFLTDIGRDCPLQIRKGR